MTRLLLTILVLILAGTALTILWRPYKSAQASSFTRKPVIVLDDEPPKRLGPIVSEPGRTHKKERPKPTSDRRALLSCIRFWESRNNYRAVSPTGKYRNAYQMSTSFWLRHGGDPAYAGRHELAPPEMQDAVALRGLRDQGLAAWPTPNRRCR